MATELSGLLTDRPGSYWLPIVLTARGPIYGEVISTQPGPAATFYTQPLHLPDEQRQPLYQFGFRLLRWLEAPPSVYLLQFSLGEAGPLFDRLWPFPAEPAVASVGVQQPDLFTCHWHCLNQLPLVDLTIWPGERQKG